MENDLTFIKDVVEGLKEEYGTRLIIGKRTSTVPDVSTGRRVQSSTEVVVQKAMRLPDQISFGLLQSIGISREGARHSLAKMDILVGTYMILVDRDDFPANFTFDPADTYVVFNHRRANLINANVFDYCAILQVKDVGVPAP